MLDQLNEPELLLLIANGDRNAFSFMYSKYLNNIHKYVFSICYDKEISQEIVQELFVKIWTNRETLINVRSIKPFLYKSAKNMLLNYIKKEATRTKLAASYSEQKTEVDLATDEKVVYNDYYNLSRNAVELLPEKRKQIFKLHCDDNLSIDEIAAKLSISKSVVKKQWYKGAGFVRSYLFKHGEIIALVYCFIKHIK